LSIDTGNGLVLTKKGLDIAKTIYERHKMLQTFFESLGVSPETAEEDACRVEHYISDETFACMKRHYEEHAH
jgi:Mn-dependent DtxR family transcriptional regulator